MKLPIAASQSIMGENVNQTKDTKVAPVFI